MFLGFTSGSTSVAIHFCPSKTLLPSLPIKTNSASLSLSCILQLEHWRERQKRLQLIVLYGEAPVDVSASRCSVREGWAVLRTGNLGSDVSRELSGYVGPREELGVQENQSRHRSSSIRCRGGDSKITQTCEWAKTQLQICFWQHCNMGESSKTPFRN